MQIIPDRKRGILTIGEGDYSESVVERYAMSECKPRSTSGNRPDLWPQQTEWKLLDRKRYHAVTGAVGYLT